MALWFGLVMAAPAVLHSCPRAMASAEGGQDAHGGHHSGHQQQDRPTNCQCLGSCAVSTPAVLPPSPILPVAVLTPTPSVMTRAAAGRTPSIQSDHLRPFATAPPLHLG